MLMPEKKRVTYDPARYHDVETVEEAVHIIVSPCEGMTAKQRWDEETPALMSLIKQFIPEKSLVLDYGCGIGRLAKPLIMDHKCRVVGIDISANMRALAASCVDSPWFCALDPMMLDVMFLGVPYFDAAIAVWTLQHIPDLGFSLRQISQVVKPSGKLFVVNNITRCVPVEGGEWADDGLDVDTELRDVGFKEIERGQLDEKLWPGWFQQGAFWAVYERG